VWRGALAAGVLVLVGLTFAAWLVSSGRVSRSYVSDIGQILRISLPDGSTTALNTGTQLKWLGSGHERHVRLLGGEALFEVKPDHTHPFEIELKRSRITVVGTRFDVYEKPDDDVVVTVLEGSVVVQGFAPTGEWREQLGPREEIEYTPTGRRVVRVVDPSIATDWSDRIFRSEGASLARVVSELGRYTRSPIIIKDPSLSALTVGGVFDIHDVGKALALVAASSDVPIRVRRQGDAYVLERAAPTGPAAPRAGVPAPQGKGP
jgi:transmembrane sensor